MSYLVLARKWRPRRFAELVGQEHVVRALSNALDSGRVHHAFLFTGTRGVGKTTIARIFAKSLNCERGTSADPCGECAACTDIDAGRFVDLLEIDAASHTGVDNVRELIDNAQYMPSRGRTKVYLIDEVHMLSKPAFNALLKTLEEPPGHVKFLLATTDPDKLPVTVLSRCLQFNLKRLDEAQIRGQMEKILAAEGIASEPAAIALLARSADGSLRDGLSLLDQAIAYTGANLDEAGVRAMLGSVERGQVSGLLEALGNGDGVALLARIDAIASFSPDFAAVLDEVAAALHAVQLRQLVPGAAHADEDPVLDALAAQLAPELVHLWYQMCVAGRRELPHAPGQRVGFEMVLLRLLAFRPEGEEGAGSRSGGMGEGARAATGQTTQAVMSPRQTAASAPPRAAVAPAEAATPTSSPARLQAAPVPSTNLAEAGPGPGFGAASARGNAPADAITPSVSPNVERPSAHAVEPPVALQAAALMPLSHADDWIALVSALELRGPARELAGHAVFRSYANGTLTLALPEAFDYLRNDALASSLARGLSTHLGRLPVLRFEQAATDSPTQTFHGRQALARDQRQAEAEAEFMADAGVQHLIQQHGARLVPDSIRPIEENRS